jgi:hypothetical protein
VGWTWSRRVAAGPEQADLVHAAEASVRGSACVRVLVRRCGRPRTVTARSRSYFRLSRMRRWLRPRVCFKSHSHSLMVAMVTVAR